MVFDTIWPEHVEFSALKEVGKIEDWGECTKQIFNAQDVSNFQRSVALQNIQNCLFKFCHLIRGKNVPSGVLNDELVSFEDEGMKSSLAPPSTLDEQNHNNKATSCDSAVKSVVDLIQEFDVLRESNPPLPGPRRYGNMACRSWHDQMKAEMDGLLDKHLKKHYCHHNFNGLKKELMYYILNSFGSRERLDYGTGHELSFLAFINALIMTGILKRDSIEGEDILMIFAHYYDLIKTLILTYTLEPAGSHGVWGLDDHFHLIYILGSAQLLSLQDSDKTPPHHHPGPSSVLKSITLQKYRTSNLYFNAISFIKKVKSGPFNEHSPVLYDISAVRTWNKVNQGMIKMWFVEVLSKFPVVQHFYFGNVLYPWKDLRGVALPRSIEANSGNSNNSTTTSSTATATATASATTKIPHNEHMKAPMPTGVSRMKAPITMTKTPWTSTTRRLQEDIRPTVTPNHTNNKSNSASLPPRSDASVVTKAPWAR